MAEERVLVSGEITCPCVKWHRPKIRIIDRHHVVPLSWDGPDEPDNLITICPNQHRLVHELLDLYKKRGGHVFASDLRPYPRFTQQLAKRGWNTWIADYRRELDA